MGLLRRPTLAGVAAAAALIALSGGLSAPAATAATPPAATPPAATPPAATGYATVSPVLPAVAHGSGSSFSSSRMSIEVVLAPRHQAQLTSALAAAYAAPAAGGRWLAKGQFVAH